MIESQDYKANDNFDLMSLMVAFREVPTWESAQHNVAYMEKKAADFKQF